MKLGLMDANATKDMTFHVGVEVIVVLTCCSNIFLTTSAVVSDLALFIYFRFWIRLCAH